MHSFLLAVGSSLKMALAELRQNKLRTFLSLFGITIGIFCIIGVLATVGSLEKNVQSQISNLGESTFYVDKWEYGGGGNDYPWWKYQKRPSNTYQEFLLLKERVQSMEYASFSMNTSGNTQLVYKDALLQNTPYYCVSEDFYKMQSVKIQYGRYLSAADFALGSPMVVLGFENARKLFGDAEKAIGKEVTLKNNIKASVVGVTEKEGGGAIKIGWRFDQAVILPYLFGTTIVNPKNVSPIIIAQGKNGVPLEVFKGELQLAMRNIRQLSIKEEDNFSLNSIKEFSNATGDLFSGINIGGWCIAFLSLIVGGFGIANIMFVTVKERTPQIGLKKALGAKRFGILTEFLLESAFLCILGGVFGLTLVFLLSKLLTNAFAFTIFISPGLVILALLLCITIGIVAGFLPARAASKLDAVVAIRSK
jgi:putative ABC transport system permease protein